MTIGCIFTTIEESLDNIKKKIEGMFISRHRGVIGISF